VDLAVTARFAEPVGDVAGFGYVSALALSNARGSELKLELRKTNGHGDTLYLGTRTSELFARLYDKGRESKDPAYRNCWRWELEVKGARGPLAVGVLSRSSDERTAITSAVHEHFVSRGVSTPWNPSVVRKLPSPPARKSDDERRLLWLSNQIAPVVGKLRARVPVARIVKAVGLNDVDRSNLPGTL
jgi:DNA relaxase NicK